MKVVCSILSLNCNPSEHTPPPHIFPPIARTDMQAFRAANPGCVFEDFIRWYSPNDWVAAGVTHHDDFDGDGDGDGHGDDGDDDENASAGETRADQSVDALSSSSAAVHQPPSGRLRYG